MPPLPPKNEMRSRLLTALVCLLLGLFLSFGAHALFERQAKKLEALLDHGNRTEGVVLGTRTSFEYEYTVSGVSYTWSEKPKQAYPKVGESIPVRYLPEEPSFSRSLTEPEKIEHEQKEHRSFTKNAERGIFGFFFLFALGSFFSAFRLNENVHHDPLAEPAPRKSELWVPHLVGFLVYGTMLSVNFFDDVNEVQKKAFGERPFGLPLLPVMLLTQGLLFLPLFFLMKHLTKIAIQAGKDGSSLSKIGILLYLWKIPQIRPELERSRGIVIAGSLYFILVTSLWIAYTSARNI